MPSLRDLEVVHRLNAPTRAAATRRRRLRKLCACACVVGAAFVATGGASHERPQHPTPTSNAVASQHETSSGTLQGRHLVPIRADAALAERVNAASRVDVWGPDGTRLASSAPVVSTNETSSRQVDVGTGGSEGLILVALTPTDVKNIAQHHTAGRASWSDLFVTARP